ncbi:MAG: PAS domain S-box protein [Microscillaceae bacterium]|nr:PAS domain S-box protein [Microscillaceae bacterium]
MMKKILFTYGFLWIINTLQASDVALLQGIEDQKLLGKYLYYLEDKTENYSIQDITSPKNTLFFQKTQTEIPRLGLITSPYWFRFEVKNVSKLDQEYIILLDDPTVFRVDFYVMDQQKLCSRQVSGISLRQKQRAVKGNKIAFRLVLPAGQQREVYFRLVSKIYTAVPVYVLSNRHFNEMMSLQRSLFGMYYGILVSICFLCFLFLVGIRNPTYLYLIFYAVFSGITTGTFDGFTPEYLHFLVRWFDGYHDVPITLLCMTSGMVFIMMFVRLRGYSGRLYQLGIGFIVGVGIELIFCFFYRTLSYPLITLTALIYVILVMCISVIGVRHKIREAYFVFGAFNVLTLAVVVVVLSLYQVLPLTFFTMYGLHFAYIIQLSILFLGVADRILALKEELRRKEIEKEHEKQQIILEKNLELEEKVKLRTQELGIHQARLFSLLENTSDVIWSVDLDYRFLTLNTPAQKYFREDIGRHVVVGDYFFDIFAEPFVKEWKEYYAQAYAHNSFKIVKSFINPQNLPEYYEFAFYTIRDADQNIQGFSVFKRDITDSRLREEKILESESKLNAIIHNNHDAIWLVDRSYQIIHHNAAFIRLSQSAFGKDPKNRQNFLELLPHTKDHQIWQQRFEKAFSGQQTTFMDVYEVGWEKYYFDIMIYPVIQDERISGVTVIARNVTDKENVQIELRKSEERFHLAVAGSQDGIWDWDIENNQVYFSTRWKNMLGYSEDELPGKFESFTNLLHPEDLIRVTQTLQAYFSKQTDTYDLEIRLRHKDGAWRWIKTSGIALFNEKGIPYRMAGSHVDITQRKEDEINLLAKEANLRAILDHNDDAVYLLNNQLELVDFNTVFANNIQTRFGIKPKIGMSVYDLFKSLDMNMTPGQWSRFERALQGETQIYIEELNIAEKSLIFEIKIYPIRKNDKIKGISIFVKDITEAKKAEDRLERAVRRAERQAKQLKFKERMLFESEMMLQTVINKLPYSIFWKDKNSVYFGCNTVFAQLAGLSDPREIIHKTDHDLPWTPSQWEAFREDDQSIIKDNIPKMDIEVLLLDAQEDQRWFSISKIPLREPDGQVYGILGMCVDITERKKQSQFLEKAKETAEEAALAKAFFLSTMTHEIRTPLNAVIGLTHLLLQDDPKPEQVENLKTLEFSAGQLMTLVNDILDYNKIEAQKIELEKITFSLGRFLNNIQKSFEPRVLEKGIVLQIIRENKLPDKIVGDQARLSQILNNLISNAIKFTKKGSVSVRLKLMEELDDAYLLRFEVQDTGIGIAEDKLEDIFDKFSQASSDINRKYGGTGLGLSITKKLLELHQSNIFVKSRLGEGSVFGFELRLLKPEENAQTIEQEHNYQSTENSYELEGLKILFVEDHPINQMVGSKFLKNWGISVDFADNGLIAIEKLEQYTSDNAPHLILMDIQMPELNGYETTKLIRNLPKTYLQNIPIIALTASMIDEVKEDIFAAGMNDYVSKPFNPNDLFNKIARYSNNKLPKKESSNLIINPMKVNGALNIDNIKKLVGDDQEYRKELIELYIDFLENFYQEYRDILENKDLDRLKYMVHKSKPSIEFLELDNIDKEVNYIRILMESQDFNHDFYQSSIDRVEKECHILMEILSGYSKLESV